MNIYSQIVETNQKIIDLELSNSYDQESEMKEYITEFNIPDKATYTIKINYAPGIYIQKSEIISQQSITEDFLTTGSHIRFFFYLKGHSKVQRGAGNMNYSHSAGMFQRNYLNENGGGSLIKIPKKDHIEYVVIKLSKRFYVELLKTECWIDKDSFHQYIISSEPENRPNETYFLDLHALQILDRLINNEYHGEYKYHFTRLKLRELIFHLRQLIEFGPAQNKAHTDLDDTLEKVRAYLIVHLDSPANTQQLAKMFNVNEKTLAKAFKAKYGCTIYAYVIESRMQKAKELILEHYNVSELAMLLGYQSISHFIKVFKNYHGCTPKEALNRFAEIDV